MSDHTTSSATSDHEPRFRAVVRPHRSLSPGGFMFVMFAVAGIALGAGLLFASLGAWPVIGFMGLDVVLIFWAFQANYFSGHAREEFELGDDALVVRSVSEHGEERSVTLNPHWVRVVQDSVDEIGVVRLALRSHGKELNIGQFLSPREKEALAIGLAQAIETVKRGD